MNVRQDFPNLFRLIVEQSPEAIIFADPRGMIRLWNKGAETTFGFRADEAVGRSLDLIIPEDLRPAHWTAYRAAIKSGFTKNKRGPITTRSLKKDGRTLYVSFSFTILRGLSGDVIGALAFGRDVTAAYLQEKQNRKN